MIELISKGAKYFKKCFVTQSRRVHDAFPYTSAKPWNNRRKSLTIWGQWSQMIPRWPMSQGLLIRFSVKYRIQIALPNFAFFTIKLPFYLKDWFLKKMLFKQKAVALFPHKTTGSNNSFTLTENNFRFFEIAKFEFKVTVHYGLWVKCTQLWLFKNMNLDSRLSCNT